MTDNLTAREQPDRSKINMKQNHDVRYWTKHLNISKEELRKAIDKVGIQPPPSARNWGWWTEGVGILAIYRRGTTLLLLTNHIQQPFGRKRLSQERCTDRDGSYDCAGHDDNVHIRVSAAGIVGEFSP